MKVGSVHPVNVGTAVAGEAGFQLGPIIRPWGVGHLHLYIGVLLIENFDGLVQRVPHIFVPKGNVDDLLAIISSGGIAASAGGQQGGEHEQYRNQDRHSFFHQITLLEFTWFLIKRGWSCGLFEVNRSPKAPPLCVECKSNSYSISRKKLTSISIYFDRITSFYCERLYNHLVYFSR
ncbi:Uncharacterised protein [Actinobacillus pleuropneumoniae]|nr:Uncharacterised protein [Actinobacillus pleuropneumoniae]